MFGTVLAPGLEEQADCPVAEQIEEGTDRFILPGVLVRRDILGVAVGRGLQAPDHARYWSPLRGWHRMSSLPVLVDRTTSSVKLLICTYRPRNRSITCAKRRRPLPTKPSSSTVMRTSMPCASEAPR